MQTHEIMKSGAKITGSFFGGAAANLTAFRLLKEHKGLKKYYVLPLLLSIVVLTVMVIASYLFLEPKISDLLHKTSELFTIQPDTFFLLKWLLKLANWMFAALKSVLSIVLIMILIFGAVLSYSFTGAIITSFFLDILSQKVEEIVTGVKLVDTMSLGEMLKDIIRVIKNTIKLVLYTIFINILLLPINFIPVIGSITYTLLSFMVASFFIGFQFFDFPLERRRLTFKEKMTVLKKCKLMVSGLGAGFFLVSFIPFVGFLGLNNATIGAAVLFIDHIKPALNDTNS